MVHTRSSSKRESELKMMNGANHVANGVSKKAELNGTTTLVERVKQPKYTLDSDPVPPILQGRLFLLFLYAFTPFCLLMYGWPGGTGMLKWTAILWYTHVFGVSIGFHRYYSHRTFKCTRWFQYLIAIAGSMSGQKGPIFWASQHRHHHKKCEQEDDVHSPEKYKPLDNLWNQIRGFIWAHGFYMWYHGPPPINPKLVPDLMRNGDFIFLEKAATGVFYLQGVVCGLVWGPKGMVWVWMFATFLSWNTVQLVNSAVHVWGHRQFHCGISPKCNSRNIWLLLPLLFGEQYHNNHHADMNAARAGFYWYEPDPHYWLLRTLSWFGVTWDLREPQWDKIKKFNQKLADEHEKQLDRDLNSNSNSVH